MIRCNMCYSEKYCIVEAGDHKYKVLKCKKCGLVYVCPKPPKLELVRHYNSRYYHDWMDSQKLRRLRMWQKRMNTINSGRPAGRLLDIGCGEGLFLKIAQENGWSVEGTEISEFACEEAARTIGKKIWPGEVWEACFDDDLFNVVTIWHVLEHGVDPLRTLKEVRRVLKSDGICIVAVPNINDWFMQLVYLIIKRKRLTLFSPDGKEPHLYHFSALTLKNILGRAGFDKVKIRPDFGIIEPGKKLINLLATIPYYLIGVHLYNSLEAIAVPKS